MIDQLNFLEEIVITNKKTKVKSYLFYEGQGLFSASWKDMMLGIDELDEKLTHLLLVGNEDGESFISPVWDIKGITKDGEEKRIVLDDFENKTKLCSGQTFFI